jgi:hypothetical protein
MISFFILLLTLVNNSFQGFISCGHFKNLKYSPCLGLVNPMLILDTETLIFHYIPFEAIQMKAQQNNKDYTEEWTLEVNGTLPIPKLFTMNLTTNQLNILHLNSFRAILDILETKWWDGDLTTYELKVGEKDNEEEKTRIKQLNKIMKNMTALLRKVHVEGNTFENRMNVSKIMGSTGLPWFEWAFSEMDLKYKGERIDQQLTEEVKLMLGATSRSFQNAIILQLNVQSGRGYNYLRYITLKDK